MRILSNDLMGDVKYSTFTRRHSPYRRAVADITMAEGAKPLVALVTG